MTKFILTSMLTAACATAVAAQTPATGQPRSQQSGTTTISGCLYLERDVPGRQPNIAERAGIGEDYIVASAAGTPAGAKMYKLEDIDDERLRALVGRRVEVTGNIDDDDDDDAPPAPAGTSGTADRSVGPDRIELPEFEATTIREVEGSCPATPPAGASGAAMSDRPGTAPQTHTATATESETHTPPPVTTPAPAPAPAPVTETPSHPAARPQPEAQTPPPQTPVTRTPTYPQTSPAPAPAVTLTGCLYRERDVPGRTPNIAERAGVLEDYILADASVQGASPSATGTTGTSGTSPAIGKMFKVEHVADEKLAQFVGKRVEVTGKIDTEADEMKQAGTAGTPGTTADRSAGPDRINLPEFEAASIREVAGTCPATPQQ